MTTYESPLAQAIIDACNAAGGADEMDDVLEDALDDDGGIGSEPGPDALPTVVMAQPDLVILIDVYGDKVPKAPRLPRDLIVPPYLDQEDGRPAPSSEIRPVLGASATAITKAPARRAARR